MRRMRSSAADVHRGEAAERSPHERVHLARQRPASCLALKAFSRKGPTYSLTGLSLHTTAVLWPNRRCRMSPATTEIWLPAPSTSPTRPFGFACSSRSSVPWIDRERSGRGGSGCVCVCTGREAEAGP